MISSSASKTFSKPSRMWMRFFERGELVLEPLGDDLEPEVQEVPEDLLEIEPLGPADLGVLGRDQAGQVDGEVDLQRRVLEEVRHDHLLVGVLLHLDARCARPRSTGPSRRAAAAACGSSTTSAIRSTSCALLTVYGMLSM